jgi:hypothetical protein
MKMKITKSKLKEIILQEMHMVMAPTQPRQMKRVDMSTMMPEPVGGDQAPVRTLDHDDEEGRMAKAQLYRAVKHAQAIMDNIGDDDELEAWVQSKITKAADYLGSVRNYLEYEYKTGGQEKDIAVIRVMENEDN